MKRFWRIFKVLMFSLFLVGIYAFAIWLAIRFPGDHRLVIIPMTIGMIAVTPKLIEKIKTHPDAEKKKPVKKRRYWIYLLAYLAFSSALHLCSIVTPIVRTWWQPFYRDFLLCPS